MLSKVEKAFLTELKETGRSSLDIEYQRVLKSRIKKKIEVANADLELFNSVWPILKDIK